MLFVNRSNFQFHLFFREKNQITLKIYTHTQKSVEIRKIKFLENAKKKSKIEQLKVADPLNA